MAVAIVPDAKPPIPLVTSHSRDSAAAKSPQISRPKYTSAGTPDSCGVSVFRLPGRRAPDAIVFCGVLAGLGSALALILIFLSAISSSRSGRGLRNRFSGKVPVLDHSPGRLPDAPHGPQAPWRGSLHSPLTFVQPRVVGR